MIDIWLLVFVKTQKTYLSIITLNVNGLDVPTVAQQIKNLISIHEDVGLIPGLNGLRIQHCCKLQGRSQMQLGSSAAVA